MTQTAPRPRPPRLAAWLVELFASAEQAESILGDLHEEFSDLASKSGLVFARRWYWRQSLKTIAHLVKAGFRQAPWSLAGIVILGFLLRRFSATLPDQVNGAILHMRRPFSNLRYGSYVWQITYGNAILDVILSTFLGCAVAVAAKGRELIATMMLTLLRCAMIGAALVQVASYGPIDFAWLPWSFADAFGNFLGGVIVREFKLLLARRHLPM